MLRRETLFELFSSACDQRIDVASVAEILLELAYRYEKLRLHREPSGDAIRATLGENTLLIHQGIPLLSAVCARLSVLATAEAGAEFCPYRGAFTMRRVYEQIDVTLEVIYENNSVARELEIVALRCSSSPDSRA